MLEIFAIEGDEDFINTADEDDIEQVLSESRESDSDNDFQISVGTVSLGKITNNNGENIFPIQAGLVRKT